MAVVAAGGWGFIGAGGIFPPTIGSMPIFWSRFLAWGYQRLEDQDPLTYSTVQHSTLYFVWVREGLISLLSVTNAGQKPERLVCLAIRRTVEDEITSQPANQEILSVVRDLVAE
jgi:hypothetical protein